MASIQPVTNSDAQAIAKVNLAIAEANRVDDKADKSDLASVLVHDRPGDAPLLYTSSLSGGDPKLATALSTGVVKLDDAGAAARVKGDYIVAPRVLYALEPSKRYLVEFAVQRRVNSPDPDNDAIRLGIAWYGQERGATTVTVVENLLGLTSGSGRRVVTAVVSRSAGTGVDIVSPAAARYARPFVQTFGSLVQSDVEVIRWTDITNSDFYSPDLTALEGRTSALESLDAGDRLDAIEGELSAPNTYRLKTVGDFLAKSIPVSADAVEVLGYYAAGDGGAALYRRSSTPSAGPGRFQSGDGSWWEIAEIILNPYMFGAKGDGITNDAAAFNALYQGGNKAIFVPRGRYLLNSYVRVYAKTYTTMSKDAVILNDNLTDGIEYAFINGPFGSANYAAGYDGDGDISFSGGTIDNGPRRARNKLTSAMAFGHARNIVVEGMTFKNNRSSHFLEINACQHARIVNNKFFDLYPYDAAGVIDYNRECINIDYSFAGGFPAFGSYDNTCCDDVLIEGNVFDNPDMVPNAERTGYGSVAVGTHSTPPAGSYHNNVRVIGNRIRNMNEVGITANGWKDSKVKDNYMENLGDAVCRPRDSLSVEVTGNTAYGVCRRTLGAAIFIDRGSQCLVRSNKISNAGYSQKYRVGVDVNGPSSDHSIYTDGIDPGTDVAVEPGYGLWESGGTADGAAVRTKVNGAYYLNLGDDVALDLPMLCPQRQGLIMISTSSATQGRVSGMVWARANEVPVMEPVAIASATGSAFTTGQLSGTTGEDGKMTVSAVANGKIYIENRTGGTKQVYVQFMGGDA